MNWPVLPVSSTGLSAAINLISAGLMIEAYLRPPRGWLGSLRVVLLCYAVLFLNIVLFAYHVVKLLT